MLWLDLKRTVHKQISTNLNELKRRYKKQRIKVPPRCERLINSYAKQARQVIALTVILQAESCESFLFHMTASLP